VRDTLRFEIRRIGGSYEGVMDPNGTRLAGSWTQGGQTLPLTLERVEKLAEPRRPQEPKEPFPYLTENVRYQNRAGRVTLAGTLTRPRAPGRHACALLITGS